MRQFRIHLFGGFEIRIGGARLSAFPTQKSTSLFTYLVLNPGRTIHRDVLCGQFWGDLPDGAARKALRTALWRIRSVVEPTEKERGSFLHADGHYVGFRASDTVWSDVWEFERCLQQMSRGRDQVSHGDVQVECLLKAASLYRGDLLEGQYDEWCEVERDRLQLAYLTVLERLVAYHQREHRWLEAITVGKRLLRKDPLREHIHRALMECHLAMGDRPSALRQYECCVRSLWEELEIEPMEETQQLFHRMREQESSVLVHGHRRAETSRGPELGELAAEVDGALRTLQALTQRLERARIALGSDEINPTVPH